MSKLIYLLGILPSIAVTLVLSACPPADAQTMRKFEVNEKDGVAMLPEIGAIIIMQDGNLKVMAVAPAASRLAAYKAIDLQEGDQVAMANGKRLAKPLELDSLYKAAKVGDQIKLGIKRGEQMMIVSFVKADEKELPRQEIKMMGGPGGETRITRQAGPGLELKDVEHATPLTSAAIIVGERKGKVVIAGNLGLPDADPRTKELKADDVIVSIDGNAVATAAAAEEALSKATDGKDVTFVVERAGKQQTITITKHTSNAMIKLNGK